MRGEGGVAAAEALAARKNDDLRIAIDCDGIWYRSKCEPQCWRKPQSLLAPMRVYHGCFQRRKNNVFKELGFLLGGVLSLKLKIGPTFLDYFESLVSRRIFRGSKSLIR